MIDVIFLLLMFFMLTSNMVTPNALNLQLPSSTSKTLASPALAVSVRKEGSYYIDKSAVTEANLESSLRARLRAMGEDPSKTVITVNAEVGAPIEYVVTILDIANRLKLKTILATNPKPDTN